MASKAFKNFLPLFDRVLVKRLEPVTKTASGLYIPEAAQAKVKQAVVVAHGPGYKDKSGNPSLAVVTGNVVMLPDFGGVDIELEGEKLQLFRQSDFLGVFEDAEGVETEPVAASD